nr:formate dehydrogenase subunit gamma [Burkholderiaceae bacterium]
MTAPHHHRVRDLIDEHRSQPGGLLPLLHAIQQRLGHVPADLVEPIARAFNLSRAEVHGVVTYYHDFRAAPAGRHHVRICQAESCKARGADALARHAAQSLGCAMHATRDDGEVTLEPVYCLGLCASSPAVQIDGRLHGRVEPAGFDALVGRWQHGAPAGAELTADTAAFIGRGQTARAAAGGEPAACADMNELSSGAASTSTPGGISTAPVPTGLASSAPAIAAATVASAALPSSAVSTARTPVRVFVPCDSAARAAGADEVATALAAECTRRGLAIDLVRNGARGLFWLDPLVEVDTAGGRVAYGPVTVTDVPSLLDAGLLRGAAHPLCHGPTEAIPFLARQQRLTFRRMGLTAPLSLDDYAAHDGWAGLRRAAALAPAAIVDEVLQSGLRGRGGAAFPAGIKWRTVLAAAAGQKYVVCNADEGDSGTYSDRMTMEGDPYMLIEGMAIAGLATGATQGYVYIRSEYPQAIDTMRRAIGLARDAGFLGADVLGSGRAFELEVRVGAGSYVCGEETALLESLEGRRGIVRAKPPLPAIEGLFGRPTVINNVITFASVPLILARGAAFYRDYGVGRSTGTLPFQLAGNVRHAGLVERAFGLTLRELLFDFGGGTASGRPVKAVQVGGPLGTYVPESQWDLPIDYEGFAAIGAVVGHGGIVVHDDTADMRELARYAMEFCAIESCGKCTPCRIGST